MTPSELAAFNAGLRHAAEMALVTALTIERRPDANQIRQCAAIEALRGLAEGLTVGLLKGASPCTETAFAGREAEPKAIVDAYGQDVLG